MNTDDRAYLIDLAFAQIERSKRQHADVVARHGEEISKLREQALDVFMAELEAFLRETGPAALIQAFEAVSQALGVAEEGQEPSELWHGMCGRVFEDSVTFSHRPVLVGGYHMCVWIKGDERAGESPKDLVKWIRGRIEL
jgi:hypothetical protein